VFFNPDNPEEAVLEPGQVQAGFPGLVVTLFVACLAGFYALKRSRSGKAKQPHSRERLSDLSRLRAHISCAPDDKHCFVIDSICLADLL
jgi:hypothetical protein